MSERREGKQRVGVICPCRKYLCFVLHNVNVVWCMEGWLKSQCEGVMGKKAEGSGGV